MEPNPNGRGLAGSLRMNKYDFSLREWERTVGMYSLVCSLSKDLVYKNHQSS